MYNKYAFFIDMLHKTFFCHVELDSHFISTFIVEKFTIHGYFITNNDCQTLSNLNDSLLEYKIKYVSVFSFHFEELSFFKILFTVIL